jgi:hypothetical protein
MIAIKRYCFGIGLALMAFACVTEPASARELGPEFKVSGTQAYWNTSSSVVALKDGGFAVAWLNGYYDPVRGMSLLVYGRHFDADGDPVGDEFKIGSHEHYEQGQPRLAPLKKGGYVATWSYLLSPDHDDPLAIFGQRYDATGKRTGPEFEVINTSPYDDVRSHSVAGLNDGGFVIVWNFVDSFTFAASIKGQRYDAAGRRVGARFSIANPADDDAPLNIAALAKGGFVVVWVDKDSSGTGISGQRFNAAGSPVGGNFRVNTYTANDQTNPAVAKLAGGGFVVAWESKGQEGNNAGIYAQRFKAYGTPVGGEFRVNTYTKDDQLEPSISGLANGGFVIAWSSDGQEKSESEVYAQRYSAAGMPGGKFRVNNFTQGVEKASSISDLDDGFVVTWTTQWDRVYGQRFGRR